MADIVFAAEEGETELKRGAFEGVFGGSTAHLPVFSRPRGRRKEARNQDRNEIAWVESRGGEGVHLKTKLEWKKSQGSRASIGPIYSPTEEERGRRRPNVGRRT